MFPWVLGMLENVRRTYLRHLGEPEEELIYRDAPDQADGGPQRVEVLVWGPGRRRRTTVLATLGMSAAPMSGAGHRAELRLGVRGDVPDEGRRHLSRFLVGLAAYPFENRTFFDAWHRVEHPGEVPLFPSATAVLLHPGLGIDGPGAVDAGAGGVVKLLQVVPLVAAEVELKRAADVVTHWARRRIDPLKPR